MANSESEELRCCSSEEVLEAFAALVGKEEGSDVQFDFDEGRPIHAHKAILAARSSYFQRLFFGAGASMLEGRTGRVHVQDCSRDTFFIVLKLLYTGTAKIDSVGPDLLLQVGCVLDRYEMTSIARYLWRVVVDKVEESTILDTIEAAYRAGLVALQNELLGKMIALGMHGVLEGSAGERASPQVVLQIARACLRVTRNPLQVVRTWGEMKCEAKLATKRKADDREHLLRTLVLQSGVSGYNLVMLKPPDPNRFTLRGILPADNVNPCYCWALDRQKAENLNMDQIFELIPDEAICGGDDDETHIQLTFTSHPVPHVQLFCNDVVVHEKTYANITSELFPIVALGDSDTGNIVMW
eukprot:TRINITY_DN23740_c0_g4_i1.p1 TRINITY_DN23740_c0_g4~~TRINITY_DN23740_c0_g4_i1.p1  ORF type:complete len:355 (-),score=37.41 TRINITY_DN23740_c0_g4_i1:54-1118(-)